MNVAPEELAKIPYLDHRQTLGRVVHPLALFDDGEWKVWVPIEGNRLFEMRPRDVQRGFYVAHEGARRSDLHIPFVETIWQHLSYASVLRDTQAINEDFSNLATSIAKLDFFWTHRDASGRLEATEFVRTELEYLLVVARSLLDHLHQTMRGIWLHIELVDRAQQAIKKQHGLPESLSRLCLEREKPRPAKDLSAKYALPASIATFYENLAVFLCEVRTLRDGVVHHGHSTGPVF